jgi:hypothetical protein
MVYFWSFSSLGFDPLTRKWSNILKKIDLNNPMFTSKTLVNEALKRNRSSWEPLL